MGKLRLLVELADSLAMALFKRSIQALYVVRQLSSASWQTHLYETLLNSAAYRIKIKSFRLRK
jgi:hypothetical protein